MQKLNVHDIDIVICGICSEQLKNILSTCGNEFNWDDEKWGEDAGEYPYVTCYSFDEVQDVEVHKIYVKFDSISDSNVVYLEVKDLEYDEFYSDIALAEIDSTQICDIIDSILSYDVIPEDNPSTLNTIISEINAVINNARKLLIELWRK